jgi:hypothetical protein
LALLITSVPQPDSLFVVTAFYSTGLRFRFPPTLQKATGVFGKPITNNSFVPLADPFRNAEFNGMSES